MFKLFCPPLVTKEKLIFNLSEFCVLSAYTLKCYECATGITGTCTTTTECSSGQQCGTLRVLSYAGAALWYIVFITHLLCTGPVYKVSSFIAGGSELADVNMKTCTMAEQCFEGSVNFGISRTVMTSKCCNSELCNAQSVPGNLLILSIGI